MEQNHTLHATPYTPKISQYFRQNWFDTKSFNCSYCLNPSMFCMWYGWSISKVLLYLVCVSFVPMRDYAGFSYASLISVMYPMSLCEIMRDLVMPLSCFCYVSLDLVMFRLSLLFRLCSYSLLCIEYYIHDTILYKGYCLWFDLLLLIDTPCHRLLMFWITT